LNGRTGASRQPASNNAATGRSVSTRNLTFSSFETAALAIQNGPNSFNCKPHAALRESPAMAEIDRMVKMRIPEILHGPSRWLVARPCSFTRALARAGYVKDLGGFGSASGSIPARIDTPGGSIFSAFKRLDKPRIGSGRMAGAQHEKPLAQHPSLQAPDVLARLTSAASA
jgi:hypothetical protein